MSRAPAAQRSIEIRGAREHNLKNLDVNLGLNQFTVITGVSGSGKSTLAFDILFAEGQRRYLESLNAYARQFVQPASRPDVDAIFGIPPTVAIEQRTSRGGHKSTVATLTEIYHFLRLLYVKLGVQYCPVCEARIEPQSADAIAARLLKEYRGKSITLMAPLIVARKGLYTALAKWARGKGFAHLRVDGSLLPTAKWPRLDRFVEHNIELPIATLNVGVAREAELRQALDAALQHGRGVVHVDVGGADAAGVFSTKRACPNCGTGFPELDPRLFSFNSKHGWCKTCFGTGLNLPQFDAEQSGEESLWRESADEPSAPCPDCAGQRLNPVALHVMFRERSIAELSNLPVREFSAALQTLKLAGRELDIARDLLAELAARTRFLCDVGLGYLQLNRAAPSLSGGEAQRIRLAAQLGSNLQGVCYVLDEPTIGLHPRDNIALLDTLERLRSKGNTLVVVEHDEETIRRADHVIDLGPGAGTRGGWLVAEGTAAELARLGNSATGRCLASPLQAFKVPPPPDSPGNARHRDPWSRAAQPAQGERAFSSRAPDRGDRGLGIRQIFACPRRVAEESTAAVVATPSATAARATQTVRLTDAPPLPDGNPSAACSKSIRRPSARLRAPARRPISDSGNPSAACMRIRSRRGYAGLRPAVSPSTRPAAAARPARARGCSASR